MANAYFFVNVLSKKMELMCCDCREKYRPNEGWYYDGDDKGYARYDFKCSKCGKTINEKENISDYQI